MPHTKTIMIVEDDEAIRKLAHLALSAYGYGEVLSAANADQALEISARHPKTIHLLVTDIMMPGPLNGCDLARMFNDERPETKVLLISGYIDSDECVREGWPFIRKPFQVSTFIETIKKVLAETTS